MHDFGDAPRDITHGNRRAVAENVQSWPGMRNTTLGAGRPLGACAAHL